MNTDIANAAWSGPLARLTLWRDPVPRTGSENMAIDELLLSLPGSWLRVYRWIGPTVSFGYFDTSAEARALFPGEGITFVRRWTGGGIVDHRQDTPFTLALSRADCPGNPASSALYRRIHGDLAVAMRQSGVPCRLLDRDGPDGGRACWASPVASDIVRGDGVKLAGGGQRRNPRGILHQGSIQGCALAPGWDLLFARLLADNVAVLETEEPERGFGQRVAELARAKYDSPAWNDETRGRRPHRSDACC